MAQQHLAFLSLNIFDHTIVSPVGVKAKPLHRGNGSGSSGTFGA